MLAVNFLLLAAALFAIGVYGVIARRNAVMVLMSIELILNAVTLNLESEEGLALAQHVADLGREHADADALVVGLIDELTDLVSGQFREGDHGSTLPSFNTLLFLFSAGSFLTGSQTATGRKKKRPRRTRPGWKQKSKSCSRSRTSLRSGHGRTA